MRSLATVAVVAALLGCSTSAKAEWFPAIGFNDDDDRGPKGSAYDACITSYDNWLGYNPATDKVLDFTVEGNRASCTLIGEGLITKRTPRTTNAIFVCPEGTLAVGATCVSREIRDERCEASAGNPIQLRMQNKRETVVDYRSGGDRPLELIRTYNSRGITTGRLGANWTTNFDASIEVAGNSYIIHRPSGASLHFISVAEGIFAVNYNNPFDFPVTRVDVKDRLVADEGGLVFTSEDGDVERYERAGAGGHYRITSSVTPDGHEVAYRYDRWGRNDRVTDSFGRWIDFEYQGTQFQLVSATSFSGVEVEYAYDVPGRTYDLGGPYSYQSIEGDEVAFPEPFYKGSEYETKVTIDGATTYDGSDLRGAIPYALQRLERGKSPTLALSSVTYADGGRLEYQYERTERGALLTAVVDERSAPFASWSYDASGAAVSSERAGGVERIDLTHSYVRGGGIFNKPTFKKVYLTDAYGRNTTYTFGEAGIAGHYGGGHGQILRLTKTEGLPSATCAGTVRDQVFDNHGNRTRMIDAEGIETRWTYDLTAPFEDRGRPTTMTRGYAANVAQTTSYEWVPGKALPARITTELLDTTYAYDSDGRVLRRVVADRTGSASARETVYTWTQQGLLDAVDGPLPGPQDKTDYAYGPFGFLAQVTTGEGYVTQITDHSPDGHPARIVEPDGTVTRIEYTERGWPTRIIRDGGGDQAVTRMDYDPVGQLTRLTNPDGTFERYIWDDARRLVRIYNGAGETLVMTYDIMSNLTEVRAIGGDGVLDLRQSSVRDELGRIRELIGGQGQRTLIDYDREDRAVKEIGPRGGETSFAWDALDRLEASTDAIAGVAATTYRTDGEIADVTDPERLVTSYERNGFGEVVAMTSPDTGRTAYERDEAGRVTRRQDARGEVATFAYDGEGRMTTADYQSDAGHGRAYSYDAAGRLAAVTDAHGGRAYAYDPRGNVLAATRTTGNNTYALGATYDLADKPVTMTYPSGRSFAYGYDGAGRIASITSTAPGGTAEDIATGITYDAGDNLTGLTHGNGAALSRAFDRDGRLTAIQTTLGGTPLQSLSYTYDPADNIRAITDGVRPARSQSFRYDLLDRLIHAEGAYGTLDYRYDGVGNRTRRFGTLGGEAIDERSRYVSGRHRLERVVDAGAVRRFEYHGSGQVSREVRKDGAVYRYELDPEGRVDRVAGREGFIAAYGYDARQLRVSKRLPGQAGPSAPSGGPLLHFVHDAEGRLIAEHDGRTGAVLREYVYLGWLPVALIQEGSVYAIHADQVAMPQLVTDASGTVVMDRVATPFGEVMPALSSVAEADVLPLAFPGQRGDAETSNSRRRARASLAFPGQRGDAETGLSQNWHRDYDPALGRYVQSDPIGLAGGLSTYGYVRGNPVSRIDPMGLQDGPGVERRAELATQLGREFGQAQNDFYDNLNEMVAQNFIGGDKYYHCKANCEATKRGGGGYVAAHCFSTAREIRQGGADLAQGNYKPGDAALDMAANRHGRRGAQSTPNNPCKQICAPYLPKGMVDSVNDHGR